MKNLIFIVIALIAFTSCKKNVYYTHEVSVEAFEKPGSKTTMFLVRFSRPVPCRVEVEVSCKIAGQNTIAMASRVLDSASTAPIIFNTKILFSDIELFDKGKRRNERKVFIEYVIADNKQFSFNLIQHR